MAPLESSESVEEKPTSTLCHCLSSSRRFLPGSDFFSSVAGNSATWYFPLLLPVVLAVAADDGAADGGSLSPTAPFCDWDWAACCLEPPFTSGEIFFWLLEELCCFFTRSLDCCWISFVVSLRTSAGCAPMMDSSSSLTIGRWSYRGCCWTLATRLMLTGPLSICSSTWFMSTFSESVSIRQ